MTTSRKARILGAIQTMKVIAHTNTQSLSIKKKELEKKREAIMACISRNKVASQSLVAQMEKSLTSISIELQSLAEEKDKAIRRNLQLMEQERIAEEHLRSAQRGERRSQEEIDCLDWVSLQAAGGRKPGTGF